MLPFSLASRCASSLAAAADPLLTRRSVKQLSVGARRAANVFFVVRGSATLELLDDASGVRSTEKMAKGTHFKLEPGEVSARLRVWRACRSNRLDVRARVSAAV